MANVSARRASSSSVAYSPSQTLCIIVGLACLAGFLFDVSILALPPSPFNIQWRINLLQQIGNRSIILLFGLSLTMYGFLANRKIRKQLSLVCLIIGVMFSVSGIVMAHDSLKFQDMTLVKIANQEDQVRTQIESVKEAPQNASPELTPEILEQATQKLSQQAKNAKQTAKTDIIKIGLDSLSSLVITGFTLIALGRFGNRTVG